MIIYTRYRLDHNNSTLILLPFEEINIFGRYFILHHYLDQHMKYLALFVSNYLTYTVRDYLAFKEEHLSVPLFNNLNLKLEIHNR